MRKRLDYKDRIDYNLIEQLVANKDRGDEGVRYECTKYWNL